MGHLICYKFQCLSKEALTILKTYNYFVRPLSANVPASGKIICSTEKQPRYFSLYQHRTMCDASCSQGTKKYSHVCVGGTFDRLHDGHRALLKQACDLATDKITVGVTTEEMNGKKVLWELMEPIDVRIAGVEQCIRSVAPHLRTNVTPISDMYGPSVVEADVGCLVVSAETQKGGHMVNDKRKENGLNEVELHCIGLVEDPSHSQYEEEKISSSTQRKRLLGTLLKPTKEPAHHALRPYVLGLTGGIASGKSSVALRLEGQGAHVIDCDKLGHRAYLRGTPAFAKMVETFGQEVVGADGEIDRKVLGPKVFSDKSLLQKLNAIVWPAIAELVNAEISQHAKSGTQVIVLDAAILLEAGWEQYVHEVWTTAVPRPEAMKRIMERNGLSEEAAAKRVDSQMDNKSRVGRAHVVLCTLWEYEYTQQQVEKAWRLLQERLSGPAKI